jgi:membrane-associated protease RseP (regulator of RpoE activity)
MFGIDYTKDSGPSTRGERTFYVIFLALVLLGFSLDLATDFEPKKMGAIVFIVAWIPLTVLHEFGHAVIARLVGWEVKEFVIRYGRIIKEFRYNETKVELRMVPIGGYILPHFTGTNWSRWKSALVYFAGPGIELVVFFAIYSVIGFDKFFKPGLGYLELVLQGIGLSAMMGAVLNLIPLSALTEKGETPNDGLGILLSIFGSYKV